MFALNKSSLSYKESALTVELMEYRACRSGIKPASFMTGAYDRHEYLKLNDPTYELQVGESNACYRLMRPVRAPALATCINGSRTTDRT